MTVSTLLQIVAVFSYMVWIG